jgi:hypothetical protein
LAETARSLPNIEGKRETRRQPKESPMNLHVDRHTEQLSAETRRLWSDARVWLVNCLAVESAWTTASTQERAQARRGRDQLLTAILSSYA